MKIMGLGVAYTYASARRPRARVRPLGRRKSNLSLFLSITQPPAASSGVPAGIPAGSTAIPQASAGSLERLAPALELWYGNPYTQHDDSTLNQHGDHGA